MTPPAIGMSRRYPLATFWALAYAISWLLWAPLWLPAFGVDGLPTLPLHHALGSLGPIAAAFLVSAAETGVAGPADLLRRMGLWRGRLVWVAVALLAPLAVLMLAVVAASLVSGDRLSFTGLGQSRDFPQLSAAGFLAYNVVSFGYGEEVGWRGFALPRLQARHSALVASLVLTLGWALWHAPLFLYRSGYTSMNAAGVTGWFFSLVTGAVLLTWLYNGSKGSLLVVAFFHAAVDVAFTSAISSPLVVNIAGALVTVCGVMVLVVTGPRYLSRRGKMVSLHSRGQV
ncbi:MAG: CPBP family intramembrane glutamic endopeptidase, partial [Vicinamibacterales bacterium]